MTKSDTTPMPRRDMYTVSAINAGGFKVVEASHSNPDVAETLCRARLWQRTANKMLGRSQCIAGALLTLDDSYTFSIRRKISIGR